MSRPRILFVTAHLPYPPVSGGRLREFELLARLAEDFDVDVRAVSKTYAEDSLACDALLDRCATASVFPAEQGSGGRECAQIERHRSPNLGKSLRRELHSRRCDLVHVEGFYLLQHVPRGCDVPVLLVEQNVEYQLARQRYENATDGDERRARFLEYSRTRTAEVAAWKRADACAALTPEDAAEIKRVAPGQSVRLVPDGCDHLVGQEEELSAAAEAEGSPLLLFVGNFAYEPNVDAARRLAREIWPAVRTRLPHARMLLVGNSPPPEILALAGDGLEVRGRVPQVEPYLRAADVVLCPLRVGGGVKVKVLEALAFGKAVVTTSIGAQGFGPAVRAAMRVADEPEAFAVEVVSLATDESERQGLERAARRAAASLPTWDDAGAALASCYRELLEAERLSVARDVPALELARPRASATTG